ncbi:protein FAR1-RELATED SEQUENCE 5-like isoform X2 [Beta vulgaris subsp. vulgaris]|uniref:protein FAR1-RELATED SEQUENCE 5-like isoform X2 n=1 Tax=Beta vulgaris subsp. vulgaris TaxID=3555 RepID=UPI0025482E4F|nr:protein FAR1-RELATED SEQUENCE 5-like isoform X2 [Beta vulgaris subsp. vulgaris]
MNYINNDSEANFGHFCKSTMADSTHSCESLMAESIQTCESTTELQISSFSEMLTVGMQSETNSVDPPNEDDTICLQESQEFELLSKIVNTEKKAYELYNEYAFRIGFGVRVSKLRKRQNGVIKGREFCCNKEGKKQEKSDKQYTKLDRRTGCKAMVYFEIDKNNQYVVVRHKMEHNHTFCPRGLVHHVRSQRSITQAEVNYLAHLRSKGVGVANGYRCLKAETGSSPALGFNLQDAYQAVLNENKKNFDGSDANTLINYFKQRKANEDDFYYDYEIDTDRSLCSFFWRDKTMKADYIAFGDLLVFDTTYNTNKYGLVCAPLVGMNYHTHNCMFGCGFLLNERISSFVWLFTTFLKSMDNIHPKTVMTDQALAMASAISSTFPDAKHRLCTWHIGENSKKHIRHLRDIPEFLDEYKIIMKKCHTEEEFNYHWNKMVTQHNCANNPWLLQIYSIKDKWCRCFGKDKFSGGVLSSQRSESTNHSLSRRLNKSTCLCDFYNAFCEVIGEWRSNEEKIMKDVGKVIHKLLCPM